MKLFTRLSVLGWVLGLSTFASAGVIDTTSGLIYHLDAGNAGSVTQSAGSVSAWADANGNGKTFSQATAAKQPTYVGSSSYFNGLPAILFDGSTAGQTTNTAPNADRLVLNTLTSPKTVIIVNVTLGNLSLAGIWGQNDLDAGVRRKSSSNEWQNANNGGNANDFSKNGSMFSNGAPGGVAAQNTPDILVATTTSTFNWSATGLGEYFFNATVAARPWNGQIAEIAAFDRVLTQPEIDAITADLSAKYALGAPEPAAATLALGALPLMALRRRK